MSNTKKIAILAAALALPGYMISAQEAILSTAETYYEFLALDGYAARPYLNYRTLSDSLWTIDDETGNVWSGVTLGTPRVLGEEARLRVYGPEIFASFNSASPYGQNDGALWQGKGLNASLTGGARLEAYGLALTLKPQLAFSQNLAFDLVSPAYSGTDYEDLADTWGYYGIKYIDAPQRFGDEPLLAFSWGDSEIRYSWKTLTAGFGTQSIWLGPAKINPLLHSNNATPYPKLDFGIRRQQVTVLGHYLGDVEARAWWGRTTESDWFDTNSSNDHNLITGLTVSCAPSILPGATFGFHRTMLSKWSAMDAGSILTLLWPLMDSSAGEDKRDQRASLSFQYDIPDHGLEMYIEWGRNDFSGDIDLILRYPFHTSGWTLGSVKTFSLAGLPAKFNFELTQLESTRDLEFLWKQTFYGHHVITQGYTNEGQWLGAGMGTGGNSQYAGLTVFHRKGSFDLFIQRQNPDNDYVWFMHFGDDIATKRKDEYKFKTIYSMGISAKYFISDGLHLTPGIVFSDIHNPVYESSTENIVKSEHLFNISASLGLSYQF